MFCHVVFGEGYQMPCKTNRQEVAKVIVMTGRRWNAGVTASSPRRLMVKKTDTDSLLNHGFEYIDVDYPRKRFDSKPGCLGAAVLVAGKVAWRSAQGNGQDQFPALPLLAGCGFFSFRPVPGCARSPLNGSAFLSAPAGFCPPGHRP